uniref:Uncharacterized protein n=1 Tax=Arundo donax TaxID=35708 RepID=A0A0A9AXG6_ARUDO
MLHLVALSVPWFPGASGSHDRRWPLPLARLRWRRRPAGFCDSTGCHLTPPPPLRQARNPATYGHPLERRRRDAGHSLERRGHGSGDPPVEEGRRASDVVAEDGQWWLGRG